MDILIANVTLLTMERDAQFGAYLGVTDGKIAYMGKSAPEEKPGMIIDGSGMVCMPGLINSHTHLAATALRTLLDDAKAAEALEQKLNLEDRLDRRSAKAASILGIAECLRFGVTSVSDLYYYPDATAEAAAEAGIKANVALSAYRYIDQNEEFDFETDEQCRAVCETVEKWHNYDSGRIRVDAGLLSEYTGNYPLWEGLADYAAEKNLGFQLHLARDEAETENCLDRTGLTGAQLLNCHRVFANAACIVGGGGLTREDRELLGKRNVSLAVTPVADAKAGIPCAPVIPAVQAGMNVCLGTGGAMDSGNLDLFEVMRYAACAERTRLSDPAAMPAQAVLTMATVCGAKAQGREKDCGLLRVGMDADLILVDFTAPHLMPCHNVQSGLVFCAKGGDVAMTMVRGKILYQNGKFPTIDLPAVVKELTEYAIPRLLAKEA